MKFLKKHIKIPLWTIITTGIFLSLGILGLVLGFGLTNGWESVALWFTGRWAIYVYILIAILILIGVWALYKKFMKE